MLEIVNTLSRKKFESLDNFMLYFGMYDDKKRTSSLKRLLRSNLVHIKGKTVVEAGAGLGDISEIILALGPKRLFCVEENALCCAHLRKRFAKEPAVKVIHSKIEAFRPGTRVDLLFHELYGAMLLEESILALELLKFKPGVIVPDGGRLLCESVPLSKLKDPLIKNGILKKLKNVLITDLFLDYKFSRPEEVTRWHIPSGKKNAVIDFRPGGRGEILAFGIEITHNGRPVCGTTDCVNWPYVFTPKAGKDFRLRYTYRGGYSDVSFRWANDR
jgi:hypothetical protein